MKLLKQCRGDCLEGMGIRNPHWLVTDDDITPKVGDLVHCARDANFLNQYVKVVLSYDEETGKYTVGSRYADPSRDFTFIAEEILGVVILMFDGDKRQVYERR